MKYDLRIESDVEVCLDQTDVLDVSFHPISENALPLGGHLQLYNMTYNQIKKYIASQIHFYHKNTKKVDFEQIKVLYLNRELSSGDVLSSMINIEANN